MLDVNIAQALSNASVVVKSAVTLLIVFYLIGLIPGAYSVLSLSPALLLPPNFRIWTLITGLLIEGNLFNIFIDIPVLIVCGMFLEPVWGAMELLKFIAITGVGSSVLTTFVSLATYAVTHNHTFWFVQFSGVAGVVGGITVAFKQILPDQKINLKVKVFRLEELPFLTIMIFIFLCVIGLFHYTQLVLVTCGTIVGWIYLRFYQPRGKGIQGDLNASFQAATLFPNIFRPVIGIVASALFHCFVSVGLCKLPVRTYNVGAPSSITISLPGTDPADAERRRKKALRALNERLECFQPSPEDGDEENWPTIEDELNRSQSLIEGEVLPTSTHPEAIDRIEATS